VKDVNQKYPAVLMQRARRPDGQRDANAQINQVSVSGNSGVRVSSFFELEHVQLLERENTLEKFRVSSNVLNVFNHKGQEQGGEEHFPFSFLNSPFVIGLRQEPVAANGN
jgi:hypothetical protein